MSKAWYSAKDVAARFKGVIGRDRVIQLMKENIIKSYWVGRSLATTEVDIEEFEAQIMTAQRPIEFKSKTGRVLLSVVPGQFMCQGDRRVSQ